MEPHAFEEVYAVFDRDDHATYHDALDKAKSLDGKFNNDIKQKVRFEAIASVPCFELWLLLHFVNIQAPLHRNDVYTRLNQFLDNYEKGQAGYFSRTCQCLPLATKHAISLAEQFSAYDSIQPYTDIHRLVHQIINLKA
ncbi:RloB family protein [Methylomonas paludis]|uniref:RloB family protein n=1 Tax=Methylomonas paludis TaxID=1173101 RepID=UPI003CCE753B